MDALRFSDRASDADWAEVLATFALFAGVRKRDLRRLVRNATFAELARGERIVSSAAGTDSLYVVLGGEANMLLPTPRSISTGDYFGELGVLGKRPRHLHVVATGELHVMELSRQSVLELARRHPSVTLVFLKDLGARLHHAAAARRRRSGSAYA
jgi:CRP-like cAMP-binding protein